MAVTDAIRERLAELRRDLEELERDMGITPTVYTDEDRVHADAIAREKLPDVVTVEGVQVQVPVQLQALLSRADGTGEILVDMARQFARLDVAIDAQVLALAKANGENGEGDVLGQVQDQLSNKMSRTVNLATAILGVYGQADPDLERA
jgi:hypothetical protein